MKTGKKYVSMWLSFACLSLTDVLALAVSASGNIFSCIMSTAHYRDGCFFEPTDAPELERAEATRSKDIVRRTVGFEIRWGHSFPTVVDGPLLR
jgi:hypothetical protein